MTKTYTVEKAEIPDRCGGTPISTFTLQAVLRLGPAWLYVKDPDTIGRN